MTSPSSSSHPNHSANPNFPDFSSHGYQVLRELGHNRAGGRVTYLAQELATDRPTDRPTDRSVVIKQFQFAQTNSSWLEYDLYEQEVQMLQKLKHPCIPRYVHSFETETGFCLVQDYKPATSLAHLQNVSLTEVYHIAIALLKVLLYLQRQNPPIVHRDIKPENVLVSRQKRLQVYLVDFGFARTSDREMAASSVVKGTLGFMPPEQLFNRQLTQASDLYSLGMTLICLLTNTRSADIGKLVDNSYRPRFKALAPKLNPAFVNWLERMTEPDLRVRFANADAALSVLETIEIHPKQYRSFSLHRPNAKPSIHHQSSRPSQHSTSQHSTSQHSTSQQSINWGRVCLLSLVGYSSIALGYRQYQRHQAWEEWRTAIHQRPSSALIIPPDPALSMLGLPPSSGQPSTLDVPSPEMMRQEMERMRQSIATSQRSVEWQMNQHRSLMASAQLASDLQKLKTTRRCTGCLLQGSDLRGWDLAGADLRGAVLSGAQLQGADLRGANLYKANLTQANLTASNLTGADLSYADLAAAQLQDANLQYVDLQMASLHHADLENADLQGTKLSSADLTGAKMKGIKQ